MINLADIHNIREQLQSEENRIFEQTDLNRGTLRAILFYIRNLYEEIAELREGLEEIQK